MLSLRPSKQPISRYFTSRRPCGTIQYREGSFHDDDDDDDADADADADDDDDDAASDDDFSAPSNAETPSKTMGHWQ